MQQPQWKPPKRRRSGFRSVLLAVVGLILLAIVGLVLVSAADKSTTAAYQNDQYQVPQVDQAPPPIPAPETYSQARDWLQDSELYRESAPAPVRCDNGPINVETASDRELERHFTGQIECLMRVWDPPVTAAGFLLPRPSVTIYGSSATTKCGKTGVNAFYCAADQQIYFSNQLASAVPIVRTDHWAADVVMAHEFGHAVQARSGLLISAHALAEAADSKPKSNQMLRRLETQADCFSGIYVHSIGESQGLTADDLAGIKETYAAVGDDSVSGQSAIDGDHGLARNRVYWGLTGLDGSNIDRCNTFTAPASKVR